MGKMKEALDDIKKALEDLRRLSSSFSKFPVNKLEFDNDARNKAIGIYDDIQQLVRDAQYSLNLYFRELGIQRHLAIRFYVTALNPDVDLSLGLLLMDARTSVSGPWSDVTYAYADCRRRNLYEENKKNPASKKGKPKVWQVISYDPVSSQWLKMKDGDAPIAEVPAPQDAGR